ncbi:MAG: hypothetical protein ABI402_02960 [Ferruginibacter sp.]
MLSKKNVEIQIKSILKSLNYFTKRIENGKLEQTDFLDRIRPLTRRLNILEVIYSIDTAKSSLENLRNAYINYLNLGCPEDLYIDSIGTLNKNEGITENLNDYDKLHLNIRIQIVDCTNQLRNDMKQIKLEDLMQDMIDNGEFNDEN